MKKTKKIILASASPRRRELLRAMGIRFSVIKSDYKEDLSLKMKPKELAVYLSGGKAKAAAQKHKGAIIIAADTFIILGVKLLGKPHTEEEARKMLRALSGRRHSVITGFTILDSDTGKSYSKAVETRVWFKKLSLEEIDAYVKTKEPLDKAGGYAIQGRGAVLVRRIEGDYFNVIGLPLYALSEGLKKFGIRVLH